MHCHRCGCVFGAAAVNISTTEASLSLSLCGVSYSFFRSDTVFLPLSLFSSSSSAPDSVRCFTSWCNELIQACMSVAPGTAGAVDVCVYMCGFAECARKDWHEWYAGALFPFMVCFPQFLAPARAQFNLPHHSHAIKLFTS